MQPRQPYRVLEPFLLRSVQMPDKWDGAGIRQGISESRFGRIGIINLRRRRRRQKLRNNDEILALGAFTLFAGVHRWHTNLFAAKIAGESDYRFGRLLVWGVFLHLPTFPNYSQ